MNKSDRASSPEFTPEAEAMAHFKRQREIRTRRTNWREDRAEIELHDQASDAAWRAWPDYPTNPFRPGEPEHQIWEGAVRSCRSWRQVHVEERWHVVVDGVEFCDWQPPAGQLEIFT